MIIKYYTNVVLDFLTISGYLLDCCGRWQNNISQINWFNKNYIVAISPHLNFLLYTKKLQA